MSSRLTPSTLNEPFCRNDGNQWTTSNSTLQSKGMLPPVGPPGRYPGTSRSCSTRWRPRVPYDDIDVRPGPNSQRDRTTSITKRLPDPGSRSDVVPSSRDEATAVTTEAAAIHLDGVRTNDPCRFAFQFPTIHRQHANPASPYPTVVASSCTRIPFSGRSTARNATVQTMTPPKPYAAPLQGPESAGGSDGRHRSKPVT